jgi:DegV family protein with EDD domain
MAAKMVEGVNVTVFDSLSLAYAEAKMALTAAQMAKEGASMSTIVDALTKIRDHQGLLISVDTLLYLVKNGRLSGASGFVGSLLKIKPMLQLSREGKVEAVEKIRTRKKALDRVVEKFVEEHSQGVEAFIIHAHAGSVVDDVRAALLAQKPELGEIKDYPLTPVVGAHAGPGALAIGWIQK